MVKVELLDTTYEQIKKDFELRLWRLQEECRHKKTKWMDEYWAMGHSTGKKVKICLKCNKVLGNINIRK